MTNTGEELINLNGNTIFFLDNPNIFTNISIEAAGRSPLLTMASIGPAPLVSFIIAARAPRGTFTYDLAVHGQNPLSVRQMSNRVAFTVTARPIPEPATMLLLGTGLAAAGAAVRRRRR